MPEARRPTADDMPVILEAIADGTSLRAICRELGIDAPSAIRFIDADDRLSQQYALARAIQGDGYGQKVAEIAQDVLDKKVPPEVARAAMDGFKWTAGRMAPKRWGEKVAHEHSGPDGAPIRMDLSNLTDEQLAQLEALLAAAGQQTV